MHKTMTMHSLFADYAAAQPDTIAIIQANQALSYGELNHQANQLAHFLHKSGVKPNTLIAVSMQRSPELIICILGILKAGCAWLPLDDTHPVERLNSLLQDARPAALITQSSSADKFQHYQGKRVLLDQDWASINTYPAHNPAPIGGADHLAYVIYTSGSTGHPKGVQIDHKSLVNYINWFGEYCGC